MGTSLLVQWLRLHTPNAGGLGSTSGQGFPGGSMVKNPPANAGDAGDMGSIPGSGRSPEGGNGDSLQYSCLEIPMEREFWQATVHKVAMNQI